MPRKLLPARPCLHCGKPFQPRKWQVDVGGGKYCSVRCRNAVTVKTMHSTAAREKAYLTAKNNGFLAARKLHEHPNSKAYLDSIRLPKDELRRRVNEQLRAYRARVPEKLREWYAKRRTGKRLPKGWLTTLKALQRGKCAICREVLDTSYHVDHITPLSAGGKHEKGNVQLLCPTCNVRKNAKDPIRYMQERGFLL